jgi:Sap, sulfolipid-1-addressing protein
VRKGAAFIFGWLLSLAVVVAVTILATGNDPPRSSTAPSLAAVAVKMLIGVVLVLVGIRQWRRMGRPKKPKKTPKWQTGIDNMSPLYAIGLATLVQPWGLVAAGVAVIVGAKLESWESYLAVIAFCVIATLAYLVMEIFAGLRPERAQEFLGSVRTWIDTHTDQVIIAVSLILGLYLIGKSAYAVLS